MADSQKRDQVEFYPKGSPIPPGATQKASDRTARPGGPPATPTGDRHAIGTPGGGSEVGGLAGSNVGDGAPDNVDLEEVMGSGVQGENIEEEGPPYGGMSGGAVGGTPAEKRSKGGKLRGDEGIRPGAGHRGDSTIGADPT